MKTVLFSITSNAMLAVVFLIAIILAKKYKKHWGVFWAAVGIKILSTIGMLLPVILDSETIKSYNVKVLATTPERIASVTVFVIMAVFVARYLKKCDDENKELEEKMKKEEEEELIQKYKEEKQE